jgi:hypothetical protein
MSQHGPKSTTPPPAFIPPNYLEMKQCQCCGNFSGANLTRCPYCQSPRLTQVIITENGHLLPLHTSLKQRSRQFIQRFMPKLFPPKISRHLLN